MTQEQIIQQEMETYSKYVYLRAGDKIYFDGCIYEVISCIHCQVCAFYDKTRHKCRYAICTRYRNGLEKPYVFKYLAQFHPVYLDQIKWTGEEQKHYVYDYYKQQILEYHQALADELSGKM